MPQGGCAPKPKNHYVAHHRCEEDEGEGAPQLELVALYVENRDHD